MGSQNLAKPCIKQAISQYIDKNKADIEHNRQISLNKLEKAYEIAQTQKNPAAMVAAEREKNAISDLHRQTVHNTGDGLSINVTGKPDLKLRKDMA